MEQEFCTTRIDWVEGSNQSVWIFLSKFDTRKEHWKMSVQGKQCCSEWKQCLRKTIYNRESKSLAFIIQLYRCYDEHEASSSCDITVYLSSLLYSEDVLGGKVHTRWVHSCEHEKLQPLHC